MIPDLHTIWIIVFVLVLTVVFDRLLLRPFLRVMQEREGATRSAREMAETSRARAQAAADEFEAKTRAARAEVYRQMEDKRRAALESRATTLAETRQQIERSVADASERLQAQAAAARAALDRDAEALAITIVERVLGRKAS
ncbi:MAG: hypothetical protein ACM3SQ_06655 [Betaproteobacteria bacterium]